MTLMTTGAFEKELEGQLEGYLIMRVCRGKCGPNPRKAGHLRCLHCTPYVVLYATPSQNAEGSSHSATIELLPQWNDQPEVHTRKLKKSPSCRIQGPYVIFALRYVIARVLTAERIVMCLALKSVAKSERCQTRAVILLAVLTSNPPRIGT